MIKNKKKGFTIVELVIVIAVIGILSAVLIPTFSKLISNAKETAKQAALNSAYTEYVSKNTATGEFLNKNEIYFSYEETLHKFEDEKYVILKTTEDVVVTPTNAESLGYVLINGTFNSLKGYYYSEIQTTPDNNDEPDNILTDEELQNELNQAWLEIESEFPGMQILISFAKATSEPNKYEEFVYNGTKYISNGIKTKEEIELTGNTLSDTQTTNGYYYCSM